MSGGYFNYDQDRIQSIIDELDHILKYKCVDGDPDRTYDYYTPATWEQFKEGLYVLKRAYIYAQRIDWLLSGDDGEESFHERLKEELEKLNERT